MVSNSKDFILTLSKDLKCDESTMTGEPKLIVKDPIHDPWMLCGCKVMEGRGTMLVIAVGPNSQWGKITALVKKEVKPTPLQEHLEVLAESIGKLGLAAAGITFVSIQTSVKTSILEIIGTNTSVLEINFNIVAADNISLQ
jgi:magnesium-transporting ATPase (P-type)